MNIVETLTSVCNPITVELVSGALRSAQAEMEALLARTAMSPFIREKKDFFVALYDPQGRMVAGTSVPLLGDVIQPILNQYPADEMAEGDLYWFNDCYGSGGAVSHTPDQVYVAPVFVERKLSAYAQTWAHFNDIGGLRPGSLSSDATDIFQEGVIIPPVRLYRRGEINDELQRTFECNSRFPNVVRGDTRASVASVRLGERRLIELFGRFGRLVVLDAFDQLHERSRIQVVEELRRIFPVGRYSFTEKVDRDGQGHGPFSMRLDLEVTRDRIVLDTRRSDDQAPGPINFLMNSLIPRMMFGIYCQASQAGSLINEGAASGIDEVLTRPGSLLQPNHPAPLGLRGITMMRLLAACMGLINVATAGQGVAASNAYVIYYLRGRDAEGMQFLLSDGVAVGYGARPFADGIDAVYYIAQENYPAEFLDSSYPVRLRRYELNCDTGGPGRWRGGCGVVREIELLTDEAMLSIRLDGIDFPPWGVNGGINGRGGRAVLNPGRAGQRVLEPVSDGTIMRRGDILRLETGGGGGWGHPYDREPQRVRADVLAGAISRDAALADYGVVLEGPEAEMNVLATEAARRQRPPTALFHRGRYRDELE